MNKHTKKSGNVKPKKEKKDLKEAKDNYSFSEENIISEAEFKNKSRKTYPNLKERWDKIRKNKRIKNTPAKLKHKAMRIAKFKDLRLVSIAHFTLDGRLFLVPAIQDGKKLFYEAEREHYKTVRDATTFIYYDGFEEKGFCCHSILPETFIPTDNINEDILKECRELDDDRQLLEKSTWCNVFLDITDSQKKTMKYVVLISMIGGIGIGMFIMLVLLSGMM